MQQDVAYQTPTYSDRVHVRGVEALADGGAVAVGRAICAKCYGSNKPGDSAWSSLWHPVVHRTDADGKVVWFTRPIGKSLGLGRDIKLAGDGGYVVVGGVPPAANQLNGGKPLLLKLDGKGQLQWRRDFGLGTRFFAVIPGPKQWIAAGFHEPSYQARYMTLTGISASGLKQWHVQWDGSPLGVGVALAAMDDGTIAAVGSETDHPDKLRQVGGGSPCGKKGCGGIVMRVSPFGHHSCDAAGKCAAITAKECDDGNACTIDLCDAAKGCVHTDAHGQPCIDGNPCALESLCDGKTCKAEPNGRLFTRARPLSATKNTTVSFLTARPGGELLGVGLEDKLRLLRFGVDGAVKSVVDVAPFKYASNTATAKETGLTHAVFGTERHVIATTHKEIVGGKYVKDAPLFSIIDEQGNRLATFKRPVSYVVAMTEIIPDEHVVAYTQGHATCGGCDTVNITHIYPKLGKIAHKGHIAKVAELPLRKGPSWRNADGLLTHVFVSPGHERYLTTMQPNLTTVKSTIVTMKAAGIRHGKPLSATRFVLTSTASMRVVDAATNKDIVAYSYNSPGAHTSVSDLAVHDGKPLVVYSELKGPLRQTTLTLHDPVNGKPIWQRLFSSKTHSVAPSRLLSLGDGGIVMTGSRSLPSGGERMLWRMDPWGNATCAASGGCFGKPVSTCTTCDAATANSCK